MKNLIVFAFVTLMIVFLVPFAIGQKHEDHKQFEINPQLEVESITTDGVRRRKSDGAPQLILGMNHKVSGETPEEIAKN